MRVIIFYRNLEQGGVQRMMVNLVNYLSGMGFEVTLLLIHKKGKFLDLVNSSIEVREMKSSNYLSLVPSLMRELKKESYDILFTATPSLNIVSILAKIFAFAKTKIVISERTDPIKEFKGTPFGIYKLSFFMIPLIYRFSDGIIAVSKGVAKKISKIAAIKPGRVEIIYNPAFSEENLQQLTIPLDDEWLNDKSIPVIISAGRLTYQKNFELLIKSIKILSDRRKVRLIILGEGELKDELLELVNRLALENSVKFVGFQMHPITWISQSDVFVLSSRWEGFGNVLIDALSAQITIVSTDCPSGPGEILDGGKYGYLLNSFEESDMAIAIEKALYNPLDRASLLERARMFSQKEIGAKYIKLFKDLMV